MKTFFCFIIANIFAMVVGISAMAETQTDIWTGSTSLDWDGSNSGNKVLLAYNDLSDLAVGSTLTFCYEYQNTGSPDAPWAQFQIDCINIHSGWQPIEMPIETAGIVYNTTYHVYDNLSTTGGEVTLFVTQEFIDHVGHADLVRQPNAIAILGNSITLTRVYKTNYATSISSGSTAIDWTNNFLTIPSSAFDNLSLGAQLTISYSQTNTGNNQPTPQVQFNRPKGDPITVEANREKLVIPLLSGATRSGTVYTASATSGTISVFVNKAIIDEIKSYTHPDGIGLILNGQNMTISQVIITPKRAESQTSLPAEPQIRILRKTDGTASVNVIADDGSTVYYSLDGSGFTSSSSSKQAPNAEGVAFKNLNSPAANSNYYVEFNGGTADPTDGMAKMAIAACTPLIPGKDYILSFRAKCSQDYALGFCPRSETENKVSFFPSFNVTTDWKTFTYRFSADWAFDQIRFMCGTLDGSLYLDDVKVTSIDSDINLVKNSFFNSGSTANWSARNDNGTFTVLQDAVIKARSYKDNRWSNLAAQVVEPGKLYYAALWSYDFKAKAAEVQDAATGEEKDALPYSEHQVGNFCILSDRSTGDVVVPDFGVAPVEVNGSNSNRFMIHTEPRNPSNQGLLAWYAGTRQFCVAHVIKGSYIHITSTYDLDGVSSNAVLDQGLSSTGDAYYRVTQSGDVIFSVNAHSNNNHIFKVEVLYFENYEEVTDAATWNFNESTVDDGNEMNNGQNIYWYIGEGMVNDTNLKGMMVSSDTEIFYFLPHVNVGGELSITFGPRSQTGASLNVNGQILTTTATAGNTERKTCTIPAGTRLVSIKRESMESVITAIEWSPKAQDRGHDYYRTISYDNAPNGKLGTLCVPYDVTAEALASQYANTTFYEITYKRVNAQMRPISIVFTEVQSLKAGIPYLFFSNTDVWVDYGGFPSVSPKSKNGLHGSYELYYFNTNPTEYNTEDSHIDPQTGLNDGGMFIILANKFQRATINSGVNAYRAYIKMSEVPTEASYLASQRPQQASARRLILGDSGFEEDEVTAIEEVAPLIDSSITYDLSGRVTDSNSKGLMIHNGRVVLRR